MKKVLVGLVLISSFIYAKVNAVVSILPQQTFLKEIGGDKVNITLMVKPGSSPHTYEPKPSQMRDISKADIYFTMGVEFENVWLDKFKAQNKNMQIVNLSVGIEKKNIQKYSHGEDCAHDEYEGHHDHDNHKGHKDPHVWVSPKNVKIIAKNIYNVLAKADKTNKNYYEKNYNTFLKKIEKTDKTISNILKDVPKGAKFMVFHPAWGYFARDYHLEQIAIEAGGKNPKPKQIKHLIEEAKEENVKAIFTSPEFSTKVAKQIASELNIKVKKVSPLNPKWSQNLINFAKAIK